MKKSISFSLIFLLLSSLSLFASSDYRTIVDKDNVKVKIPLKVDKVVNLWPSFNGTMISLGASRKLAYPSASIKYLAWGEFFSPGLRKKPDATNNMEELLMINPDLIVASSKRVAQDLRRAGLPVINLSFDGYESLKKSILILGEALGDEFPQKSIDWGILLDKNIAEVKKAVSHLKEDEKPIVYYISGVSDKGIYATMGADSIQGKWVEIAGGRYASTILDIQSGEISAEAILKLNPDVVIIGGPNSREVYKTLMASSAWKDIKAIKNNRVHINPHGIWGWDRFGAESVLQIPFAATIINPHLYKADIVQNAKDYYKNFANVELTTEQAQNMVDGYGPNKEPIKGHKSG